MQSYNSLYLPEPSTFSITNLLPAVMLAGPPHSGKSVLAYLLSQHLRQTSVQHILLRAVPDGEGDWSYESPDVVRLQYRHKGLYTPEQIDTLRTSIERRALPMLVDIGGKPEGDQFGLFDVCTHVVQLYRTQDERLEWQPWLESRSLIPVAELRSYLSGSDVVESTAGVLRGDIGGLIRDRPESGPVFELLLARIQGIFDYPASVLEAEHLRRAPAGVQVTTEADLARLLGIARAGHRVWWKPEHLQPLLELIPAGEPVALYGPGPVWLCAAIAAHVAPAPCFVFDARHYGWMAPPDIVLGSDRPNVEFSLAAHDEGDTTRLEFVRNPQHYVLTPRTVTVPPLPVDHGVLLDGAMPKWLWAALARALHKHPWLAAREPREGQVVRFHQRV